MKKSIKHIIREQLNDKMRKKFMIVMSKILVNKTFKDDEDYYYILSDAFHKTKKSLKMNFSSWSEEVDFMGYLIGCFIQSGHADIKDSSFVTEPKKQVYEFKGGYMFSEGGFKEVRGELEGYSMSGVISESKQNDLTKKDEKLNHYIEYYKNLSPDGFSVKRGVNNEIIIELSK